MASKWKHRWLSPTTRLLEPAEWEEFKAELCPEYEAEASFTDAERDEFHRGLLREWFPAREAR